MSQKQQKTLQYIFKNNYSITNYHIPPNVAIKTTEIIIVNKNKLLIAQ